MKGQKTRENGVRGGGFVFPVIANAALILVAAIVLSAAAVQYRGSVRETTRAETRFVTTEWQLLRELKEETDRLLEEKEREIAVLRRRYLELRGQDGTTSEQELIEAQLREAEGDRDELLSARIDRSMALLFEPDDEADLGDDPRSPEDGGRQTAIREVLDRLPRPSDAETAEPDAPPVIHGSLVVRSRLEESRRRIEELETRIAESGQRVEQARSAMPRLGDFEVDVSPGTSSEPDESWLLELVETRALLRAIAASAPIREEYPDLADNLDRYFEEFGSQRLVRGRREGFEAAAEAVERMAAEIGIELGVNTAPDTPEGYIERLVGFSERALELGVPDQAIDH